MDNFLIVCAFAFGICAVGNVSHIAKGEYPSRNRNNCVWDAFLNFCFAVWAIILILG